MSLVPTGWSAEAGVASDPTLLDMIEDIGAQANLDLCLDAGALASWPGSGQIWHDLSGNGNDFYRGLTAGLNTSDPNFIGTPGALTEDEYWNFDGGDIFIEEAAHTFAETWHKDNAAFTLFGAMFVPASPNRSSVIFATRSSGGEVGVSLNAGYDLLDELHLLVGNGSGSALSIRSSDSTIAFTRASWNFFGVSLDEASNETIWQINADVGTVAAGTYTSPSAAASVDPYTIGGTSGADSTLQNGHHIGLLGGASRAWSAAELDALYDQVKTRFTAIP